MCYFQPYEATAAFLSGVSPRCSMRVSGSTEKKAGQPVCVYLVFVPAIKRACLGIRGKRPIGEHIDTIAARNAARIDQLVLLCPVAKPEEAGVIRHHAFRVHPEPVALSDTGDAPGRAAAVHILVDTKLDIFIWQNWDAEKSSPARPVHVHQSIRCPLRRPAS